MEGKIDKVKDQLLNLGFSKEEEKHSAPKESKVIKYDLYGYRYTLHIKHFTLIINFFYEIINEVYVLYDESGFILFDEESEDVDNTIYLQNFESIEDIQTLIRLLQ